MQQRDDGRRAAHWTILPIPTARYRSQRYIQRGLAGGEGGRGLRTSNVVSTYGGDRATGVVATERFFLFDGPYVGEKVWRPYDIKMVSY